MNFTRLRMFRPRSSKQHGVNFIIFAFEWSCFYLSQNEDTCDKNIHVLHILWTFGLKRRSMQRGELYSEENFNIREIWKSQVIYCWGLEDKIWIKVGANMKYEIITLSASFILLSVLIGMVRSLYLSINSRELFNEKPICPGLPCFIQSSFIRLHFVQVTHFRMRLEYIRFSDFHPFNCIIGKGNGGHDLHQVIR